MHPDVHAEFERLLRGSGRRWSSVLEIGTPREAEGSLLFFDFLEGAKKHAVDLGGPYEVRGVDVLGVDARSLPCADGTFDLVLCNSVLEHEPEFWVVLGEIERVLTPGGTFACGVPAFSSRPMPTATVLGFHAYPNDFYRFSASAMRRIFFNGYQDVVVREIMEPPRVVGMGTRWQGARP